MAGLLNFEELLDGGGLLDDPETKQETKTEPETKESGGIVIEPVEGLLPENAPIVDYRPGAAGKFSAVSAEVGRYIKLLDNSNLTMQKEMVLKYYVACGSLTVAARSAGVNTGMVLGWVRTEKDFAELMREACGLIVGMLETEGIKRALSGSDRLLIKMLEALEPGRYGRKTEVRSQFMGRMDINVNSWAELSRKAVEENIVDAEEIEEELEDDDKE